MIESVGITPIKSKLSNRILGRCTECHHCVWIGDECEFCKKEVKRLEQINQDLLKEKTKALFLRHKEQLEREKERKKNLVSIPKKKEVISKKKCVVCKLNLANETQTCSPVCRHIASKGTYTKDGFISEVTREEAKIFLEENKIKRRNKKLQWEKDL